MWSSVFLEEQSLATYPQTTPGKQDFKLSPEFRSKAKAPAVYQMWALVFLSQKPAKTLTGT